jgi:hypothetical protein
MRMREQDRLMAISRCDEYIKEYEGLSKLLNFMREGKLSKSKFEQAAGALCTKWRLPCYIRPRMPLEKATEIASSEAKLKDTTEEAALYGPVNWFDVFEVRARPGSAIYREMNFSIDITKSEKELLKDYRRRIRIEKQTIPKQTRKTTYDRWEVYDLHQTGLSLLAIAIKRHGKTLPRGKRNPEWNPELWPPYNRVRRAYKQAESMVKAAEQSARLRKPSVPC